jgi:uncharacterized protein RhaS with RHS repeats
MRDYDPTTGRYIEADPLGLVDGPSVYGYALQNPGRYVDPTGEVCTYYTLPDGNTGIRCTGGSTYNPSGASSSQRSAENVREDWPEYDACVAQCLDSEPMTKLSSWYPISESTRAQCGIVSALAGKALKLPRPLGKVTTLGCRRSLCEDKCVSCEK